MERNCQYQIKIALKRQVDERQLIQLRMID